MDELLEWTTKNNQLVLRLHSLLFGKRLPMRHPAVQALMDWRLIASRARYLVNPAVEERRTNVMSARKRDRKSKSIREALEEYDD